jgi:hypothetical protein
MNIWSILIFFVIVLVVFLVCAGSVRCILQRLVEAQISPSYTRCNLEPPAEDARVYSAAN